MKLSFIVPVYNSEKYIKRCIDSLLEQDLPSSEYEIFIINDGSTDRSLSIVLDFAKENSNIRIHSTPNQGVSEARNIGVNLANGDYIFFIDSDDYITSNSIKILIEKVKKYDLDVLSFKINKLNSTDIKKNKYLISSKTNLTSVISGKNYIENNYYYYSGVTWYIFKKEYLKKIDLKFVKGRMVEDFIFTLSLFLKAEKISHIPLNIYWYIINANSISTAKDSIHYRKVIEDYVFMILKLNETIKDFDCDNNKSLIKVLTKQREQKVIYLLKRLFISDLNRGELKSTLHILEKENIYPLPNSYINIKRIKNYIFFSVVKNYKRLYGFKTFYRIMTFRFLRTRKL